MNDEARHSQAQTAEADAGRLAEMLVDINFYARQPYIFDLSHQSIRALQFINRAETPPRVDEIAKMLGTAASTASELAKRMERKGLITRRRSKIDERVVEIRLTDAGQEALANHTSADPKKLRAGLASLPDPQRRELIAAAEALLDALKAAQG